MRLIGGLDELAHRRALKRWEKIGAEAQDLDLFSLQSLRHQAQDLRTRLDRVINDADRRIATPVTGASDPSGPPRAEWVWRPEVFSTRLPGVTAVSCLNGHTLGDGTILFHDCPLREITLRQTSGKGRAGSAPQELTLDVLAFEGSFASVVMDLPRGATDGLTLSHILQVDLAVELERPIELFARLNIKHGPNTEQMVREFDLSQSPASVEFDLAYTEVAEAQVEKAWLDLILEAPGMNRVELRDLVISRRIRAEV